jgi:hypothetical protein
MRHFTMRLTIFLGLIFVCFVYLLEACSFSLVCQPKMSKAYIESSCGLTNGVRFEELMVDTFYSDGKPKIYRVKCSYSANPYANEPASKVKDRIFFDGDEGGCYWFKDTASNGLYLNFGVSRERLDNKNSAEDSAIVTTTYITYDSMVVTGSRSINSEAYTAGEALKCPLSFKPDTWYYVDFRDQRYEAYLYVDSKMVYHLSKNDKPTNF